MVDTDKRGKFVGLAENRVNRAVKDMRLIGNLANRSNYSYTDEDAKKIVKALKDALEEVRVKFDSGGRSDSEEFKL
jgi:hypothetical protein